LTPCLPSQFHIPKYERIQRLVERIGGKILDPGSLEAYLLLMSVPEEIKEIANVKLACHRLGEGRITVLVLLLENQPEPLSHSQLADLLGVTKGSITGLVDGLENDGLVKRCENREDRRTRMIEITPAGLDLVNNYLPEKFRGIERLMARLTPTERETLVSLLQKVQEGIPTYRGE
jgi:DNA-binding MarR family transcriptional regulator